jgi:hypothetical protein
MKRTFRISGIALVLMAILVLSPVLSSPAYADSITVTLRNDGTEHNRITTDDPDFWTDGTLYESEYASNQQTYQAGSYWVVEYDLDDVRLYEDSAGDTWLYHDEDNDLWTYNDDIGVTMDSYTLVLPEGAEWVSSEPTYDSRSGNTLIWYNTDYQHTSFRSEKYNEAYSVDSGVSGALILGALMLIVIAGFLAFLFLKKKNGGTPQQYQAQPGAYGPYAGAYGQPYQNNDQAQYGEAPPPQNNQQPPYGGAAYVPQSDQNAQQAYPPQNPPESGTQQGTQQTSYGGAAYVPHSDQNAPPPDSQQGDQTIPFSPSSEEENQ